VQEEAVKLGRIQVGGKMVAPSYVVRDSETMSHFVHRLINAPLLYNCRRHSRFLGSWIICGSDAWHILLLPRSANFSFVYLKVASFDRADMNHLYLREP
jgi:hypothetical protein